MSPSRHLAAIMFTDIVGYTVLMGKDEDKALELLRKNREIHRNLIKKHQGNLIKEMGDGNLVQFKSALEAVKCAIEIQQAAQRALKDRIRIGIHLGDISFEEGDVFGDGVNIASRLQSIADPGGIYVSEPVQKSIRVKNDIHTIYLGEIDLKNVDYPVRTFAIKKEGLPVPNLTRINKLIGSSKKKPYYRNVGFYIFIGLLAISNYLWFQSKSDNKTYDVSSLIFLPFDNFTGTDTLEYMMAGMHDALIGEVGKIGSLRVPGRKTANAYKETDKSFPEIATELNVDAGIETSVTCYDDKICFQVKLVSAFPEERQIWIKDYTVDKSQIQNWYKKLAKEISQEISITLTPGEESLLTLSDSIDPVAYDLYMKGKFNLNQINEQSLKNAKEYFRISIEKEPEWALPYAGLMEVGAYQKQMRFEPDSIVLPMIAENMTKALALDPNSAYMHYVLAVNAVWTEFDWKKGEREFLKSLELNPNYALAKVFYAHLLMILRRTDEALIQGKEAVELEPLDPFIQGLYADVLRRADECEKALEHATKGLSIEPNHYFATGELLASYTCLGEYQKAYEERIKNPLWEIWGVTKRLDSIYSNEGWGAYVKEEIRQIENRQIKDGMAYVHQFMRYLEVGNHERALDYMEEMWENRDPNVPYFSAIDHYKDLKENPRYIELLKKMNLPVY